jgi:HTH-type transcriptional regulator / antitoxin HigA
MVIRPIKTKRDYAAALRRIEELMNAAPNTPKGDELDVLATLVEAYEKKHYPILPPDPIEAIKFRMEQLGLSRADLALYLGGRNRVTEVLNGQRGLSIKMIRELHKKLHIPAESLLG